MITSDEIIKHALSLGFSSCGIAQPTVLNDVIPLYNKWLEINYDSNLQYMYRNVDKRISPFTLFPYVKSIISVTYNYLSSNSIEPTEPQIAKYAYNKDYHIVIREKLDQLLEFIKKKNNTIQAKIYVDTAPVLESVWAEKAGLGWIGKNTLFIDYNYGSFVCLGEIFINQELDYNEPGDKKCGTCNRCIEACPTKALEEPYLLNCKKCISYLTKEAKEVPEIYESKISNYIIGCDVCQDVCPHNSKTDKFRQKENSEISKLNLEDWLKMDENTYLTLFKNTTISMLPFEKVKKNLNLWKKNNSK